MSEIQVINDPDVVTGHTEIINSTSIEHIVTGRNAALLQTEELIQQLADISTLTSSIGGKTTVTGRCVRTFVVAAGSWQT